MKKIILIIAIVFCIFQMIVLAIEIDIGSPAVDGNDYWGGPKTLISQINPANATGKITSVEIYAQSGYDLEDCEIATFFVVSGNNLSTRDNHTIGAVVSGSKKTFEVDLEVQEGDYIGIYFSSGRIESTTSADNNWWLPEDRIPCTNFTFNSAGITGKLSIYGTGATAEEEAINSFFFGTNF